MADGHISHRPARILLAPLAGLVWYVLAGALAFWPFYSYYDEHGVGSETRFKVVFTIILAGVVLSTLASSLFAARVLRTNVVATLVIVAIGLGIVLLPSLAALALANDCLGVSFPWDGGCPE